MGRTSKDWDEVEGEKREERNSRTTCTTYGYVEEEREHLEEERGQSYLAVGEGEGERSKAQCRH